MDDADKAEENIEKWLEDGINHARYMLEKTSLKPCGACYYCGSSIQPWLLFCADDDCQSDYVYEQKLKRIAGK